METCIQSDIGLTEEWLEDKDADVEDLEYGEDTIGILNDIMNGMESYRKTAGGDYIIPMHEHDIHVLYDALDSYKEFISNTYPDDFYELKDMDHLMEMLRKEVQGIRDDKCIDCTNPDRLAPEHTDLESVCPEDMSVKNMLTDIDIHQSLSKTCISCSKTLYFEEFLRDCKSHVRIVLEPSLMDELFEFAEFADKLEWDLVRYDDRDGDMDTYDFKSWTRRDNRWRTFGEDMAPSLMRILNKNRTQKNGKYSLMLNAWEVETLPMILSAHIRFVLRSSSDDFQDCEWEEFKIRESKMKGRLLETITKQTKDYIGNKCSCGCCSEEKGYIR